jgi:hypothetical protein
VEKFDQINVVAGALKVLLQENENARFQDKRVVNGNGSNTIFAVPARLTTAGDRGVHHIISDEEVGLQLMEKKAYQAISQAHKTDDSILPCLPD